MPRVIFQRARLIMLKTEVRGKKRLRNAFTRPVTFFFLLASAEHFMQSSRHPIITAGALAPAAPVNSDPRDSCTAGTGSFDVDTLGRAFFVQNANAIKWPLNDE